MDYNLEHCLAILVVGGAGIMGIMNGNADAGYLCVGGILGYAFKNGKVLITK